MLRILLEPAAHEGGEELERDVARVVPADPCGPADGDDEPGDDEDVHRGGGQPEAVAAGGSVPDVAGVSGQ